MSEWQPIDTWPCGVGDLFLVYVPSAKRRKVTMSDGRTSAERWFVVGGYTVFDDRGNSVKATHWMPLPAPPDAD